MVLEMILCFLAGTVAGAVGMIRIALCAASKLSRGDDDV